MTSRKKTARDNSHPRPGVKKGSQQQPSLQAPIATPDCISLILKELPGVDITGSDLLTQAKEVYDHQSDTQKQHIADAYGMELGKMHTVEVRECMLRILSQIDKNLPAKAAYALRLHMLKKQAESQHQPAVETSEPGMQHAASQITTTLSMVYTIKENIRTRRIAILAADGVNGKNLHLIKAALIAEGAAADIVTPAAGNIVSAEGTNITADKTLLTAASVFYDAVYVPGGAESVNTLETNADAIHFLNDAFRLCKPIAADAQAHKVLETAFLTSQIPQHSSDHVIEEGIIIQQDFQTLCRQFISAIARHRFWDRELSCRIPA